MQYFSRKLNNTQHRQKKIAKCLTVEPSMFTQIHSFRIKQIIQQTSASNVMARMSSSITRNEFGTIAA